MQNLGCVRRELAPETDGYEVRDRHHDEDSPVAVLATDLSQQRGHRPGPRDGVVGRARGVGRRVDDGRTHHEATHRKGADRGDRERERVDAEREPRADGGRNAGDDRTDHVPDPVGDGESAVRGDAEALGEQRRDHHVLGAVMEIAEAPQEEADGGEQRQRRGVDDKPDSGAGEQRCSAEIGGDHGRPGHPTIGQCAQPDPEQHRRDQLGELDDADVERRVGERECGEGERDDREPVARERGQLTDPVPVELSPGRVGRAWRVAGQHSVRPGVG